MIINPIDVEVTRGLELYNYIINKIETAKKNGNKNCSIHWNEISKYTGRSTEIASKYLIRMGFYCKEDFMNPCTFNICW